MEFDAYFMRLERINYHDQAVLLPYQVTLTDLFSGLIYCVIYPP